MPGETAGFLGTDAPWRADATLVVEIAMGLALGAGAVLARRGWITAHKYCQSVPGCGMGGAGRCRREPSPPPLSQVAAPRHPFAGGARDSPPPGTPLRSHFRP